jgi:hypothetical protein
MLSSLARVRFRQITSSWRLRPWTLPFHGAGWVSGAQAIDEAIKITLGTTRNGRKDDDGTRRQGCVGDGEGLMAIPMVIALSHDENIWAMRNTKSPLETRLTFFPRFLRSLRSLREAFSTLGARPFCDGQRVPKWSWPEILVQAVTVRRAKSQRQLKTSRSLPCPFALLPWSRNTTTRSMSIRLHPPNSLSQ